MRIFVTTFVALFLLAPVSLTSEDEKTPLYFSYITAITGPFVVSGNIPVVDYALELVNNRTDILANYTLKHTQVLDSGVSEEGKGLVANYACKLGIGACVEPTTIVSQARPIPQERVWSHML